MDIAQINRVYFIGIGGIGMSALARYFMRQKCVVSGYDRTETEITDALQHEGAQIHFSEDLTQIDTQADLVIYTPAVPPTHAELIYYRDNGFTVLKRSQVLGLITKDKFVIAVAGSHGKTTVSSMIAWILKNSGYDCTAILGGISTNFNSNYVMGFNDVFVVEADEYDRSFLQLSPNIAVITATDSDHLEVYGTQEAIEATFLEFANRIKENGLLISKPRLGVFQKYQRDKRGYDLTDSKADLYAVTYAYEGDRCHVTLNDGYEFYLGYPGVHNIENAIAAISVALHLNIHPDLISRAITAFTGVHRRFELVNGVFGKIPYYDDYAHHPEEIKMFLTSIKQLFPNKKIT
ncbi:MAG TPA: Mur ligase family protein, partial [Chitinophagales bacterium]|nr:Mur ligase family protein [Chitinophagales bacterium]